MEIQKISSDKEVIQHFHVDISVLGKTYPLFFKSINSKFEDFTEVRTTNGMYFSFTPRTRKKHYKEILAHINKTKNNQL